MSTLNLVYHQLFAASHLVMIYVIFLNRKDSLKQKQYGLLISQAIGSIICIESKYYELDVLFAIGYSLIFTSMIVRIYRIWKVFEYSHRNVFNLKVWQWYIQLGLMNIPVIVYIAFKTPNLDTATILTPLIVTMICIILNERTHLIFKKMPEENSEKYITIYHEFYYLLPTLILIGLTNLLPNTDPITYFPFFAVPFHMVFSARKKTEVEPMTTTFLRRSSTISGLTTNDESDTTFTTSTLATSWSTETLPQYNAMD